MHPIERLRAVARAGAAPPSLLAREAAGALGIFGDDPAGLVTACRRLLDRQPACAPLWWLSSRVLSALDPSVEARASVAALEDDPTEEALASCVEASAAEEGEPLVVWATAMGVDGFVCERSAVAAMAGAREVGAPVWLVVPLGTALPIRLWHAYLSRLGVDVRGLAGGVGVGDPPAWAPIPTDGSLVVCSPAWASMAVGPAGLGSVEGAARAAACPVAPELLKISA